MSWNGEKFSIYSSEEKSVLKLIQELGKLTNINIDVLKEKTDKTGDHKGTWQGLSPTQTDIGLSATVEKVKEELNNVISYFDGDDLNSFIENSKSSTIIINKDYEDYIINVNKDNLTLIIDSVLKVENISINGKNSGIVCTEKGVIKGFLNYAITTRPTATTSSVLYFEKGHNFKIGDMLSCSYGLGGDGKGHAKVIDVKQNYITLDKTPYLELPSGVEVGNYEWGALVTFNGENNFFKNGNVTMSRGYSITSNYSNLVIENLNITNGGLDMAHFKGGSVTIKDSNLGNIIDCAKSGLIVDGCKLTLERCIIDKNNSDGDIVINDNTTPSSIDINLCEFRNTNTHVEPFAYKKFATFYISSNTNNKICEFINVRNSKFTTGLHGLFFKHSNGARCNIGKVVFENCDIIDGVGELRNFTYDYININNSQLHDVNISGKEFILNDDGFVNLNNCKIINMSLPHTLNYNIENCVYINSPILLTKFIYNKLYMLSSPIAFASGYLGDRITNITNLIIADNDLQDKNLGGGITPLFSMNKEGNIIEFSFPSSQNKHFIVKNGEITLYFSEFYSYMGKMPVFTPKEYKVMEGSKIIDRFDKSVKTISKGFAKTISNISGKNVYLDTSNIVINDYINIVVGDTVVTSKITSIGSGYITISDTITTYSPNAFIIRIS